ncbi:hypothetical protein PLESTB_001464200 [Pleodorina starrii]|uniref:Uncharacterized protein n=1 Tax=Pleodorina starrii TaxID=330485 RepID=A0A9W6BVY0_9CHLO|nr:hypothetical protein PLESTM_001682300 [Pleodorina starrii]GLC59228.1 hypothetical protein PLESTB_001464200 [Pleodorina starrii]
MSVEIESLAHLDALLAGSCGERYEAHPEEERQLRLATMVQEERCTPKATPAAEPQPAEDAGALAVQLQAAAALSSRGGRSCRNDGPSSENVPPAQPPPCRRCAPAVLGELEALCLGAVSEDFLLYALERKFQGNAEALASWLLDSERPELQSAKAEWEAQRQRELQEEEAARLLKERNKQHILQKFDLRPVAEPKDPKKAAKSGPSLEVWTDKQQQAQKPKVRYLDGRVVSTKGEKFIVEKTGEEWDGGSRGKVYTKGKRGKGFM